MIRWVPEYHPGVLSIQESASEPWCKFSVNWQHGNIPVPNMFATADTVRGVFEGLKLVGKPGQRPRYATTFFTGPGRPRILPPGEMQFGWYGGPGPSLGLIEAHHKILIPTYLNMLKGARGLVQSLYGEHETRGDIDLWDGVENDNPLRPEPLSAAAILTAYLNESIDSWTRDGTWSMFS